MSTPSTGRILVSVQIAIDITSENTWVNNVVSSIWLLTIFSHQCDPPFLSESFPFCLQFQIFVVFQPAKMKTFPKCDPYLRDQPLNHFQLCRIFHLVNDTLSTVFVEIQELKSQLINYKNSVMSVLKISLINTKFLIFDLKH